MARAKLYPAALQITIGSTENIPISAVLLVCVIGYFLCFATYFSLPFSENEYNIAMLAAFTGYLSQCFGFLIFRTKLKRLKRTFHSPFGVAGALYAAIIFFLGIISIVFFQRDYGFSVISYCILLFVLSIYYLFIMKGQTLSPEEDKIMFVVYSFLMFSIRIAI
jgi:amino acid transporter